MIISWEDQLEDREFRLLGRETGTLLVCFRKEDPS